MEKEDAGIPLIGEPILTPAEQAEKDAQNVPTTPPVEPQVPPVEPQGTEPVPPVIQDVPHKEDPSRYEFWQSKFTKEQDARKQLEEKINEISGRIPVKETPKPEPLLPPQRPQRPAYYDATDAFNAPESDSYKYEVARERYFEDLAVYNQKFVEVTLKPFQENIQKQQEQTVYQQKKAMTVGEIQGVGAQPVEAGEVFDFFTSPESLKPENLLIAFRAIQAQKQNPKLKEMDKNLNPPLPPGLKGSGGEVQETADDKMNKQMMGWGKKH